VLKAVAFKFADDRGSSQEAYKVKSNCKSEQHAAYVVGMLADANLLHG
jgi:hypothetical protein